MLNIPDSIKNLFQTDGVRKNFRASFPNGELPDITNANIVQESVRFTESLCSQDVLKFGLTEASVIEFETVGVANMYGMQIRCSCEIDVSGLPAEEIADIAAAEWDGELVQLSASDLGWPFFRVPYGEFRVESCPRNHEAMARRKVTAYTKTAASRWPGTTFFPEPNYFPEILVDASAFSAEATNDMIKTELNGDARSARVYFFDSRMRRYTLTFHATESYDVARWLSREVSSEVGLAFSDFVEVKFGALIEERLAALDQISHYMDSRGWDLTYDVNGNKIFDSNRHALTSRAGWLFTPGIYYDVIDDVGVSIDNVMSQPLISGRKFPIINGLEYHTTTQQNARDFAFARPYGEYGDAYFSMSATIFLGPVEDATRFMIYTPDNGGAYEKLNRKISAIENVEITTYKLRDYSNCKILVENSGKLDNGFMGDNYNSGTSLSADLYSYENAIDTAAILDGYLELNAQFGKVDRWAGLQLMRISDAAPVALTAGQYRNFWWDEFNVAPIGKITAAFTDEGGGTQEFSYRIGPGASTYDMSGNAVLQQLYGGSVSRVQQLLAERFVPHLAPVNFTPIDLNMKGLPYLEDGDYLAVTAEDGTVAYSYNMRHELEGVQVLAANVTSVSGEIIDSEEGRE